MTNDTKHFQVKNISILQYFNCNIIFQHAEEIKDNPKTHKYEIVFNVSEIQPFIFGKNTLEWFAFGMN